MLLCLPNEVLEEILLSPPLAVSDLCRVRRVCQLLRSIVDRLWTRVAMTRLVSSHVKKFHGVMERWKGWGSLSGSTHQEWYSLCRERFLCEQELLVALECLSRRCYKLHFTDEDELELFSVLLKKGIFSYNILLCVLSDILDTSSHTANLTHQFYALHGKEYMIRQRLISEWKELMLLTESQQTLEKGAILIAQWMRPCHCPSAADISLKLNSIAEMVARRLIGGPPAEEKREEVMGGVKRVKESALVEVVREGDHSVDAVLAALNSVLYDQLGYRGAGESYYELENSFIDQVLEKKSGIPITLSIMYESVARRLGVQLSPVNFPQHFVLQVPPDRAVSLAEPDRCVIDTYSRGQRLTVADLNSRVFGGSTVEHETEPAKPVEVYVRILNNISHLVTRINIERTMHTSSGQWLPIPLLSFLYLRTSLVPLDVHSAIAQHQRQRDISTCFELQYNPRLALDILKLKPDNATESFVTWRFGRNDVLRHVASKLEKVVEDREAKMSRAVEQKQRPITTNVKFCVGMVMKHKKYHYRCVIYGWDEECKMSEDWILQMNVDSHPPGRHQPFYNVLAHDGSNRYAAQANLIDCPSEEMGPIPHWEVGKYFTHFTGKKYIPNAPVKETYPDDP